MEQQCNPVVDKKTLQTHLSRYRGELYLMHLSQAKMQSKHFNTEQGDLASVYDLLQSMHASIGQDIADLEVLLVQSGQHREAVVKQPAYLQSDAELSEPNTLSCKENEVLNMFAKGYSYNEVAELLGCKLATIQTHTKRIYKKLHVHSRSEAIFEARQLDILIA